MSELSYTPKKAVPGSEVKSTRYATNNGKQKIMDTIISPKGICLPSIKEQSQSTKSPQSTKILTVEKDGQRSITKVDENQVQFQNFMLDLDDQENLRCKDLCDNQAGIQDKSS